MPAIRTVLGDIVPDKAGITLTHEHVRYAYQGCEFDHNNVWDFDTVAREVGDAVRAMSRDYGVRTMVDLTPPDIGRHPALLAEVSRRIPIAFPTHPRTRSRIEEHGLSAVLAGRPVLMLPPVGYLEMLGLMQAARLGAVEAGADVDVEKARSAPTPG